MKIFSLLIKACAVFLLATTFVHAQLPDQHEDEVEELMKQVHRMLDESPADVNPMHTSEDAVGMVKQLMGMVGQGQWVEAIVAMKPYLNATTKQYEELVADRYYAEIWNLYFYGDRMGAEMSRVEEIGNSLIMVDCLEKFATHMIRWRFYLYRADDEWSINHIEFERRREKIFSGE
jgi:hypothetical protein